MPTEKDSLQSSDDEPILTLIDKPMAEMDEDQLRKHVKELRNFRTLNQTMHQRLAKESKGKKKAAKKKAAKVKPMQVDYLNLG